MGRGRRLFAVVLMITLGAAVGLGVVLHGQRDEGSAGQAPFALAQEQPAPVSGSVSPNPPSGPAVGPEPQPTPPPRLVEVSIGGQVFTVPSVVEKLVDLRSAEVVADNVNGRSYVVAGGLAAPGTCYVEIPAAREVDPVIGCDEEDNLIAKGGWLIYHTGSRADVRSGLLILPPGYTATRGSAGRADLEASGRAVIFRDLPRSEQRIDVITAEGREFSVTFGKPG